MLGCFETPLLTFLDYSCLYFSLPNNLLSFDSLVFNSNLACTPTFLPIQKEKFKLCRPRFRSQKLHHFEGATGSWIWDSHLLFWQKTYIGMRFSFCLFAYSKITYKRTSNKYINKWSHHFMINDLFKSVTMGFTIQFTMGNGQVDDT